METFIAKPKKWGNSLGVVIPKEVLEAEDILEGEQIELTVTKRKPSRVWELAGTIKLTKSTDDIIKEIDEGYHE